MDLGAKVCALISLLFLSCDPVERDVGSTDTPQVAWIELGRHLFYERRLSLNKDRSCGICHEQAKGFTDGFVRAVGTTEEIHPRNTLSLINVNHRTSLGWISQGHADLEDQLLIPLLGEMPVEMGLAKILSERLEELNRDQTYQELITPLGLTHLTLDQIAIAIAHFERSITSYRSPYDVYLSGEDHALNASAQRGLYLFFEVLACGQCHGGVDFDQPDRSAYDLSVFTESPDRVTHSARHGWFNTGLYNLNDGRYPPKREGVFELTGEPEDIGRYRVPTLRNLAFTAPYYHDGSGASLVDVLNNYNQGGRVTRSGPYVGDGRGHPNKHPLISPLGLTSSELSDLKSFLESLNDESIIRDPRFSDPWPRE